MNYIMWNNDICDGADGPEVWELMTIEQALDVAERNQYHEVEYYTLYISPMSFCTGGR